MTQIKHDFLLVALLGVATVLAGCNDKAKQDRSAQQGSKQSGPSDHPEDYDHGDGSEHAPAAHIPSTRIEFVTEPAQLRAGEPATWSIRVLDAESSEPIQDFAVVHDKLLHLIIASKDLSWFNHVHPEYEGDGLFTLASAVVPRGGKYKLYADYTPQGGAQEIRQHEFDVQGEPRLSDLPQLKPDAKVGPWLIKRPESKPEGMPDTNGKAAYEVALMPMPSNLIAGQDVTLHFQIRDSKGQPIKDLEPYLGALGHVVIISSDGEQYLHSHPMTEGAEGHEEHAAHSGHEHGPVSAGGPDVMFHASFPDAGLYKIWGQFMHEGLIITAAFVVDVK